MHFANSALRTISQAGAILAAIFVGVTALTYVAEVVARYGLNSPINISGDLGSYLLCISAFLAIPLITRHRGHIAVTLVVEMLPPAARRKYNRVLELVSAAVLLIVAFFVFDLCMRQFNQGVLTNMSNQIPRWWLTAIMTFGIVMAALNFIAPADKTVSEVTDF